MKTKALLSRIRDNSGGFTLVEAIVAIAMIGIVSVGITSLLFSLSRISRMSEEQLKQNAVYRIVRENAAASARESADILGNPGKKAEGPGTNLSDLVIMDRSGRNYPQYLFDLTYTDSAVYGDASRKVDKYMIVVKKSSGEKIFDFYIEIYPETGG